jgi:hypothetical protein
MNPLETYIRELLDIRSSGAATPETSYYPALSNLLNEVGKTLKPKVRCIINIKNRGAGLPDGGLFTPDQFQKTDTEPLPGTIPAHGVIEVKPTSDDAWLTAEGEQVSRYWGKYRQVLVTNLRDFLLVGQDAEGNPVKLEDYRLAGNEKEFWRAAAHPLKMAKVHGERFIEFLQRVMLSAAPLATPKEVAWFLASYAREGKARIEKIALPALSQLRADLEEALGLKFEGTKKDPEKGERFFRSTLVQTIFYGVFSAWVLWSKKHPPTDRQARFDWRKASWDLHVPMVRALFEQLTTPSKLAPLGMVEILDWTEGVLNRVDRASFFDQFQEGQAVQYFYEPFLKAFDPKLRKDYGVWYTPPEIVQYMVSRVDTVLREELAIPDGLADPRVYVLDPCCGTGAYLIEVLKHIAATLRDKGGDALVGHDVKQAALHRVFGFEILPAPFVVSHLQLGLLLQNLGAPLTEAERAGVYLTNALTGWEPPEGPKKQLPLELEEERDASEEVKREKPILVILGNPPYDAFAGVSPKEEQGLVEPYKEGLRTKWRILAGSMHDLYIRFFRLAERRIAEMTGQGVVSYISNHSWVREPSFVVLRHRLLASFDRFWIENMHGNRKISEYAPNGRTSETIFAIPGFSSGIQQGVAISLWVKSGKKQEKPTVLFRDDLNAAKAVERRAQLLESLEDPDFEGHYLPAKPNEGNRFSFLPFNVEGYYYEWPKLVDFSAIASYPGMDEDRRFALISLGREELILRMKNYFDKTVSMDEVIKLHKGFGINSITYNGEKVRNRLLQLSSYKEERLMRYVFRPFDLRWCYYEPLAGLWHRASPKRAEQVWPGNLFIISRPSGKANPEGVCLFATPYLSVRDMLAGHGNCIPIFLRVDSENKKAFGQNNLFGEFEGKEPRKKANLSPTARKYLTALNFPDPDVDAETAGLIWWHALAIGYAPAYLTENTDGICQDWPRVPLPENAEALENSANLGREIAGLLDPENPVPGVTAGALRPEIKTIAVITRVGGGALDPDAGELALSAKWGYAGKDGVTMPGKGKAVKRDYTPEERNAIRKGAVALGLTFEQALAHLGESTFDIYLNEEAYWSSIPEKVWNYYIGGYQIIKKWLSYRENKLLGRPLTGTEAREVMNMARRLAAIVLMEPALNANYQRVKSNSYPWSAQKVGEKL